MITNFRDISASNPLFINEKQINRDFFEAFKIYAEELTVLAGKSKDNKSNKASSYVRYLVKLIILYRENFNQSLGDLYSLSAYKELHKLTNLDGYFNYNKKMNRFPNATLRCFLAYLTFLNSANEEEEDIEINKELNGSSSNETRRYIDSRTILKATKKTKKVLKKGGYRYPRNILESNKAKIKSDWKCEYVSSHETFINIQNNKPYVDAHHLIPMAAQDYFDNTIDFADNIICLCPTCHSKIHYSVFSDRKKMVKQLFNQRKTVYKKYDIDIDEKKLLTFYGIF